MIYIYIAWAVWSIDDTKVRNLFVSRGGVTRARGWCQQERKSWWVPYARWLILLADLLSLPLEITSGGHATTIDPTSGMQTSISYFRTAFAADRVISEWVWDAMAAPPPLLFLGACLFVPRNIILIFLDLYIESSTIYRDYFFFDSFLYRSLIRSLQRLEYFLFILSRILKFHA